MNENHPFFSIITVNLNSGVDFVSTISSVNMQVFRDFEHVVIDGGSTDISREILKKHSKSFAYFCSEKDKGIYDAINKGISKSNGEYIILLHSGDYLNNKNTLKKISEYILNNPLNDIYLSDVLIYSKKHNSKRYRYYPCNVFTPNRMRFGIMPPHPAIFFKRGLYERIGLYKTEYTIAGDFDLVVRLFQLKDIRFIYSDQVYIKMNDGGLSDKLSSKITLQRELLSICNKRNVKTNHFFLLFRFLLKFPGVIPKVARLIRYFK